MTAQFDVPAWGFKPYELTAQQAAAMQATGLVHVEVGTVPGEYALRGLSAVGVAAGQDWELRVTSHLNVHEVLFLVAYARNPSGWRTTLASFAEADTLLATVAWGFAAASEDALRSGPLRGYRRLDEASPVLRGRIRIGEQLARGGLATPVLITRDEYDLDVPENRLLLAAAVLLTRTPLVAPVMRARLRRVIALLDGVSPSEGSGNPRTPPITRLNRHYAPAIAIAELVVRGMSLASRAGGVRSVTFAFDLSRVFEDFLEVALGAALRRRGATLDRQPKDRTLDVERTLGLEPDFVVRRLGEHAPLAILDAKFKSLGGSLGDDAYQMLSYLLEFGPRRGLLVSATGERSDRRVRAVDKRIGVRPLTLDRPPPDVLTAVDSLAEEVVQFADCG
jgi:5-methylcytosine-specific restriction enzyme subunit McrC